MDGKPEEVGKNFDWIIIKCSSPGILRKIQLDTHHFKGNYPDKCSIQASFIPNKTSEKNIVRNQTDGLISLIR